MIALPYRTEQDRWSGGCDCSLGRLYGISIKLTGGFELFIIAGSGIFRLGILEGRNHLDGLTRNLGLASSDSNNSHSGSQVELYCHDNIQS
jgi:hypothetical protein